MDKQDCRWEGAWGLNTLTSKYVFSNRLTQKPMAAMSRRVPSCLLDEAPVRISPVTGCSSDSVQTSLQTSVRRLAVKSRISLCLMEGKPPLGHDTACSMENLMPQLHVDGVRTGCQL